MCVTASASALRYETDSRSSGAITLNATFEYFRRLKKNGQRGRAVEYTLIALLITFAALQAFFAVGLKAI